jgi:hypothetical protein
MKKMGILLAAATFTCSIGATAFARDFNAVTVTAVHTGETPTAHAGKQCHFKVDESCNWFVIMQGGAGEFNCAIVLSAFESGRKISFDQENNVVKFLCISVGNC